MPFSVGQLGGDSVLPAAAAREEPGWRGHEQDRLPGQDRGAHLLQAGHHRQDCRVYLLRGEGSLPQISHRGKRSHARKFESCSLYFNNCTLLLLLHITARPVLWSRNYSIRFRFLIWLWKCFGSGQYGTILSTVSKFCTKSCIFNVRSSIVAQKVFISFFLFFTCKFYSVSVRTYVIPFFSDSELYQEGKSSLFERIRIHNTVP